MKFVTALVLSAAVLPATMHADDFSSPVSTGISVGGTPQRAGVGATVLNGTNYVYFVSTDGYLSLAKDSGGNYGFANYGRVTVPGGNIGTSLNPAATSQGGLIYVAYIANNSAYVTYSSDGTNFTSPVYIPVPGSPKIDGEITLSSGPNGLYLGLHNGTNQTLILCSTTLSLSASCFTSNQGSTYAPGVAYVANLQGGQNILYAGAQSSNSSHTLLWTYFLLDANDQLTGNSGWTATGGNADQTSMQPSVTLAANGINPSYTSVTFSFRSNDASGKFLFKSYNTGGTNYWTQTHNSGYGMTGSPDLIASTNGYFANFYVANGTLMYTRTPAIPQ